jgi:mannose-6-phosphate isomerase-like protein (cupin superfamily)
MAERQAAPGAQVVEIHPQMISEGKTTTVLARTDILSAFVQVIGSGGENNLHSHTGSDAFWLVLDGEVTFYGEGNAVLGRLGRHQAIVIPRGTPYWFESSSPQPLVILRVAAHDQSVKDERVDRAPKVVRKAVVEQGRAFG